VRGGYEREVVHAGKEQAFSMATVCDLGVLGLGFWRELARAIARVT